jgi:hypothetical protein
MEQAVALPTHIKKLEIRYFLTLENKDIANLVVFCLCKYCYEIYLCLQVEQVSLFLIFPSWKEMYCRHVLILSMP